MDKLTEIMQYKRDEMASRGRPVRDWELQRAGAMPRRGHSFVEALTAAEGLAVIAEIKRKSPSAGAIADIPDAAEQARIYYNAGADALSVLTDEPFFGGSLRDLWTVTDFFTEHGRPTPCLRKDFMVHPLQVLEAAEAGARCILIIVRALDDDEIRALADAADAAKLDILYEIHSEPELERALRFKPRMIGVNNRDLARFKTDLAHSEKLIPQIPADVLAVSESGIRTVEDGARVKAAGARAILVGETLMKAEDPEGLVQGWHAL